MAPRRRMRRQASSPAAKVEKPKARRSWAGGRGWMRRRASVMTPSVPSLPDEELGQVGPGGGAGTVALGVHDAAVGQHHLEPDDHVLDLPVAGRVLAGAAAGEPAADRREVHRLGPVAERCSRRPTVPRASSRSGPNVPARTSAVSEVSSTRDQTVEPGQVEGDAAVHRDGAAADAAAAGGSGHRHDGLVAGGQHGGDLVGRGRPHHDGGALRHGALGGPADGDAATSRGRPRPGPRRRCSTVAPLAARRSSSVARGRRRWPRRGGRRRPAPSASIGVTGVGSVTAGRARPSAAPSGRTR